MSLEAKRLNDKGFDRVETYISISTTNKAAHDGRLDLPGACGLARLCELRYIQDAHRRGIARIPLVPTPMQR